MANIKSQVKRAKTNEKARLRNKAIKSELKTLERKFNSAITEGEQAAITSSLAIVSRKLDKAVSKGAIHRNQAANRKSSLARRAKSAAQKMLSAAD